MDRFSVITGTTSGIGHAAATELLERGWHVLGVGRRPATIAHADYEHVQIDLADIPTLSRALHGRLTATLAAPGLRRVGLVNNAADAGLLGPIAQLDSDRLGGVFAVNVAAPIWLMGAFVRHTPPAVPLRIVNVSSGAAVRGFPGLGAYGASKAALRMAGMVLASEVESERPVSILSYEPGTVDTPMQASARSQTAAVLPSVSLFINFAAEGRLVSPEAPAAEIAAFLEADSRERFVERRLGA